MLVSYHLIKMSDSEEQNLDDSQKNQNKVGQAESDPSTASPTENLREKAAEMTDESQDSKEPA
jgi:hypothetical protein